MARCQFKIHAAEFMLCGFIFNAEIGHGNLAVDHTKHVLFGDPFLRIGVVFSRAEFGQIAIEIPLEFIVENDAQRPAASAFDPVGFLVVDAIQNGVVFGLSRLYQTVINLLIFGEPVGVLQKPLPLLGQGEDAQRLSLRGFKGLFCKQRLLS